MTNKPRSLGCKGFVTRQDSTERDTALSACLVRHRTNLVLLSSLTFSLLAHHDTSTSPAECREHYTTLEHGLSPQTGILLLPLLQLERLETCRHSNNPTSRTLFWTNERAAMAARSRPPAPPPHHHHCLWTNGRGARPLPFALPSPPNRRMGVMAVMMAAPMNWREKLAGTGEHNLNCEKGGNRRT
ncbi:hypothetical protein J6590_067487 [Homalodisca vitripennis]|nr:hypothetical protein J6590_067487 [Homalodisca vitripennis]